jgi:CRP-like cAMP-binding protein
MSVTATALTNLSAQHSVAPIINLRSVGKDELATLERLGKVVSLRRDQALFVEGDAVTASFKVITGAVRSCRLLADGRRHISEFFLPGDFIALDTDGIHRFTAEAVADTTLARYPHAAIEQSASREPRFARQLFDLTCHRLWAAQRQMLLLGRKTAVERIASFLLEMADRSAEGDHVFLPMTRSDIADHLGLTTETVSRAFTQLRVQGFIELSGPSSVIVRDSERLEALAEAA